MIVNYLFIVAVFLLGPQISKVQSQAKSQYTTSEDPLINTEHLSPSPK